MNTFGPVFLAVIVGGGVAVAVVLLKAATSETSKSGIRRFLSGLNLVAIAWGFSGIALACLVTVAAAGMSSNERLLPAILMRPTEFLVWPALVGFVGGLSVWIIKKR